MKNAKQKKLLRAMMRDDAKAGLYPNVKKSAKVKTKKVEIRLEFIGWDSSYAFARPNAETWSTGYARPFTARRGAQRHFKDFIAKGGRLVFINNY